MAASLAPHLSARHAARGNRYEVTIYLEGHTGHSVAFLSKNGSSDAYPVWIRPVAGKPASTPAELLDEVIALIEGDKSSIY